MANSVPMWWMRGNGGRPQMQQSEPEAEPDVSPAAAADSSSGGMFPGVLAGLAERLQHPDGETLLLLALLWLLYQEKADRKLLLALAYIVL